MSTTPALSQVNESWTLSDCTVARCEGHNHVALLGRKPVASIHCVNGHPPVRVSQESEPCDFHFECECKPGWAEGQRGTRREPEPRPTVPAREGDTPATAGGRPRFAEPTVTAASAAGRGPWVRGLLSQEFLSVPLRAAHWPGLGRHGVRSRRKHAPHTGVRTPATTGSLPLEAAARPFLPLQLRGLRVSRGWWPRASSHSVIFPRPLPSCKDIRH